MECCIVQRKFFGFRNRNEALVQTWGGRYFFLELASALAAFINVEAWGRGMVVQDYLGVDITPKMIEDNAAFFQDSSSPTVESVAAHTGCTPHTASPKAFCELRIKVAGRDPGGPYRSQIWKV